ncbi:MAG: ribosome biogenesis GTPase Der [Betaproteobacteria bacterium]|nr:ribosome biogenesis GTPase Der [Betaproteobacteria bacterium]NDF03913.1 ribosome biogenesis GTPase Der [Betaproteobacteria bacterium]
MSSKPVVALVGRPNVGKSTLFNRLTRSRDALVADMPGLTRDRHFGEGRLGPRPYLVVDTGGFEPVAKDGILAQMAKQTLQAVAESDVVIFMVDGRLGVAPQDLQIAQQLRKTGRPTVIAVNKLEGLTLEGRTAEFYELGLGTPLPISGAHGDGVFVLLEEALSHVPEAGVQPTDLEEPRNEQGLPLTGLRVAIVGRPNVGKSTLVNTLLGEERVIAFDMPGTTRDAIEIPFERQGTLYRLIDTAGLRRKGRVFEAVEKFSVIKTLQAIESAHVVILLLDAQQDISDQDAHIAGFVLESGRALVVGVNKWDGLDSIQREDVKRHLGRKLPFLSWAKFHFISALNGHGVDALMRSVLAAYAAATRKLSTPKLTRCLREAVERQQPPRRGNVRPKLRYAHQGGQNPPIIVVHGNSLDQVSDVYKRYLEGQFREVFDLEGTPLRIEWKVSKNPYAPKE